MADALKAEGNKLFSAKNYPQALEKYSAAIDIDGKNAVLYANRAACYLNMKEYLNAASDATQSTKLDPKYAKAHARLGTAHDMLSEHWNSVKDWQNALDNLVSGDEKTREQYAAGLCAAQVALKKLEDTAQDRAIVMNSNIHELPWQAARKLLPGLVTRHEKRSSAWVVYEAYQEFMEAVNGMNNTKFNGPILVGRLGMVTRLTNGILQDNRVFHITDNNFISNYNRQVQLEATQCKASKWTQFGPEKIKEDAVLRLQTEGWSQVRPALSVTIRCWIMRAFIEGSLRGQRQAAVEFLSQALNLLEWGRQIWHDVSPDLRGVIFSHTFIRGVRNMHLHSLMEAHADQKTDTLEELLRRAEDVIQEIDANPGGPPGVPGMELAFGDYCKGHAYAMKGYYYNKKANMTSNKETANAIYSNTSAAYLSAAECFPQDDEQHAWFLNCAIQAMWNIGASLREQLAAMDKLHESIPLMMKIWAHSSMSQSGRDQAFKHTMEIRDTWNDSIRAGKATLDSRITPSFV